jgi:hypothetical protein
VMVSAARAGWAAVRAPVRDTVPSAQNSNERVNGMMVPFVLAQQKSRDNGS